MREERSYQELNAELCKILGVAEDTKHSDLREAFLARIKKLACSEKTEPGREERAEEIEEICGLYFEYNKALVKTMTAGLGDSSNDHPEAKRIKLEAGAIIRALQKSMIALCHCELVLHYTRGLLSEQIAEASQRTDEEQKDIEWSYELPRQIAIACRRRDTLSEYMVRMRKAKAMIEKLDPAFDLIEKYLKELVGEREVKGILADFTGELRKLRFTKAEDFIKKTRKKKSSGFFKTRNKQLQKDWDRIEEMAWLIAKVIEKVSGNLLGRTNKIFLRSWELKLAYEDMERQLSANRDFVAKHEVPEIRYRYDALEREKSRLYDIGTFETYLELLEKMQKGCAFAMPGLKEVKSFEAECFNKAREIIDVRSKMVEQTRAKIEELSHGPDPESVPDEALFSGLGGNSIAPMAR